VIFIIGFFITITKVAISELDTISSKKKALYFNGSAYFDSTVIYISLDGFRNDYLDRKVTPNIQLLGKLSLLDFISSFFHAN
jgi:predicted AlkP superfamily pyrophosphatase or phosphodiesterase